MAVFLTSDRVYLLSHARDHSTSTPLAHARYHILATSCCVSPFPESRYRSKVSLPRSEANLSLLDGGILSDVRVRHLPTMEGAPKAGNLPIPAVYAQMVPTARSSVASNESVARNERLGYGFSASHVMISRSQCSFFFCCCCCLAWDGRLDEAVYERLSYRSC
jgi:hypothetical protein